jgi:hypothetical protein
MLKRKLESRDHIRQGNLPFRVSGGVLSGEILMGWQIVDDKGFTVAVSNDSRFSEFINDLVAFAALFDKLDGYYILSDQRGDGRVSCTDQEWTRFKEIHNRLYQDNGSG